MTDRQAFIFGVFPQVINVSVAQHAVEKCATKTVLSYNISVLLPRKTQEHTCVLLHKARPGNFKALHRLNKELGVKWCTHALLFNMDSKGAVGSSSSHHLCNGLDELG